MIPSAETTSLPEKPRRPRDTSLYGIGPDDRLINLNEVKALTSYGGTSVYAKTKLGIFPAPVKLGAPGGSRWVLGEIRKFIADTIAARDRARNIVRPPQGCQSALEWAPRSASKRDPFVLRFRRLAVAPSELVGVAETARARVSV